VTHWLTDQLQTAYLLRLIVTASHSPLVLQLKIDRLHKTLLLLCKTIGCSYICEIPITTLMMCDEPGSVVLRYVMRTELILPWLDLLWWARIWYSTWMITTLLWVLFLVHVLMSWSIINIHIIFINIQN